MSDITRLIHAVERGDARASAELLPAVYDQLRELARSCMAREGNGHTLQATALVHEAYLRLMKDGQGEWDGRRHFFVAAAEAMRRILIERARRKQAIKHGGERDRVPLDDEIAQIECPLAQVDNILELDAAIEKLAQHDPPKAQLVKLLFFTGMNLEEAASLQGISRATAHRHWVFSRAWLHDAMTGEKSASGST